LSPRALAPPPLSSVRRRRRGSCPLATRLRTPRDPRERGYDSPMGRWFTLYTEVLFGLLPESDYALALEQLAEALPLEVAVVDDAGRVIVWNRALALASGVLRDQAVGRPLLDAFPALSADRNRDWAAELSRTLLAKTSLDLPHVPLSGRVVRALLAPLHDAH